MLIQVPSQAGKSLSEAEKSRSVVFLIRVSRTSIGAEKRICLGLDVFFFLFCSRFIGVILHVADSIPAEQALAFITELI